MTPNTLLRRGQSSGFSMIEILIGLAIGMLASLVVLQLFADNEARNRTASGSADAQTTGAITLYQMQSNIQRAGYGFNSRALFKCNVSWKVAKTGATISKPVTLAPVSINPTSTSGGTTSALIPAGDNDTDIVMVIYGNGNSQPEGSEILSTTAAVYNVRSPSMFNVGDRVIAARGTTADSCGTNTLAIDYVTAVDTTTGNVTVSTAPGAGGKTLFNLGAGPNGANAVPTTAIPNNGPTILVYAIRSGVLTVCDFNVNDCSLAANSTSSSVWVPMSENIVSMRALYRKDASGNLWDGSTVTDEQTQPTSACTWARVWGIQLMLVTRSDEYDKNIVTRANTTTVSSTPALSAIAGSSALSPSWNTAAFNTTATTLAAANRTTSNTAVVLGTDDTSDRSWRHYRYRAFQTLIPIRNVPWMIPRQPASGIATWCS